MLWAVTTKSRQDERPPTKWCSLHYSSVLASVLLSLKYVCLRFSFGSRLIFSRYNCQHTNSMWREAQESSPFPPPLLLPIWLWIALLIDRTLVENLESKSQFRYQLEDWIVSSLTVNLLLMFFLYLVDINGTYSKCFWTPDTDWCY